MNFNFGATKSSSAQVLDSLSIHHVTSSQHNRNTKKSHDCPQNLSHDQQFIVDAKQILVYYLHLFGVVPVVLICS